ncbi:MAG: PLP-dependent transferase [Armatimonadetes bacterium]|nr:PLP-dependent transferase [Armatimonadota bacterium]
MYVDHTITIESLEKALKSCPHAKAVFILSPTYYGATAPLGEIVELAHSYGKIIMIDEAWGPHLNFHPGLPISAMQAGADICVNSTHKLISGISQGSMLHVKGKAIDRGRLQAVLRIFLSTSPNSLIIASLDTARMQMMIYGEKLLGKTLDLANWAREEINKIPGFKAYGKEIIGHPGVDNLDLTRLTFSAKNLNFSGYEIEKILRNKYKIQIELSDLFNVIALITIGHSQEDLNYLIKALNDLAEKEKNTADINSSKLFFKKIKESIILPEYPPLKLSPREAFFAPFETINFKNSNRYISAELVTPYPPGIPILCPGEEITQEIIDYIEMELKAGIHIQGPVDQNLNTIRVVRQKN